MSIIIKCPNCDAVTPFETGMPKIKTVVNITCKTCNVVYQCITYIPGDELNKIKEIYFKGKNIEADYIISTIYDNINA